MKGIKTSFGVVSMLTALILMGASCKVTTKSDDASMMENQDAMMEVGVMENTDSKNSDDDSMMEADELETEGESMMDEGDAMMESAEKMEDSSMMEEGTSMMEEKQVVKEISLEAKQWEFVPAVVTVNQGDLVRLTVTSTDVAHGIAISAFGVNKKFDAGETVTVEFTADKAGTFPIVCNVFCGSGHGSMKGSLIVQ